MTKDSLFRTWLGIVLVASGLTAPSNLSAQLYGVLGLDGIVSDRSERAFGIGGSLAYGDSTLIWQPGGVTVALKVMGIADAEFVTGGLTDPSICILGPDQFYYRQPCDPAGNAVPPELAESGMPVRFYTGGYLLLDVWRFRAGGGWTLHPGAGNGAFSVVGGFATSPSSWIMVEGPSVLNNGGWRLRLEVFVAGPEYFW